MNDMRIFTRRFRVRHHELDFLGHLNHAACVRLMQEAAIAASTDAGFSPAWYREQGTGWVIRRLQIRYHAQAHYGEELEIATWVSDIRRVSSHREYRVTRASDGAVVARARVNWVYLTLATSQPARITENFHEAFQPAGALEDLGIRLHKARRLEDSYRYVSRRRVQTYELDTLQHVHHAVYLDWVVQVYFDALRLAGYRLEELRQQSWLTLQGGHDIEYFQPAWDNDDIEIVSWVCEMARVRGAWTHEIYHAGTKKLIARDYSMGIFVDARGKPVVPPQEIVAQVLRGPGERGDAAGGEA